MTRGTRRLIVAGALLLLALVLALVARDVRRWDESVAAGDERFRLSPGPDDLWKPEGPDSRPGARRHPAGLRDDLRLREAAQLYRRSRPRSELRTPRMVAYATSAQVALGQVQQSDAPPRVRSMAANELGVLALVEMQTDPTQARDHARRATTSSRRRSSSIRRTGPRGTTSSSSSPCASRGAARSRSRTATTWAGHGRGHGSERQRL